MLEKLKQLDGFKRVAWTAVQAFIGAVVVLAPGVANAPNLEQARALGTAAIIAGVAAALSAIKNAAAPPAIR